MDIYRFLAIDKTSPVPIYQQLVKALEKYCRQCEEFSPLPSERDLCEKLSISRTILRKALSECVEKGILVKSWGKGIFVAEKRQRRVLVTMTSVTDYVNPCIYILPGVEKRAAELGITLETIPANFLYNKDGSFVTELLEREKFDGVLFLDYACPFEEGAKSALLKSQIPVYFPHVGVEYGENSPFHCGYVDSRKAFREAMTLLAEQNCKNILTLAASPSREKSNEWLRGYAPDAFLDLQRTLGLPGDREMILSCRHDAQSIASALDDFMASGRTFDGILCFSDFYAIHAMDHLKRCRIRVPEDVPVMGYCGYPGGEFMDPSLSTMDYHYFQLGYEALDILLKLPPVSSGKICRNITSYTTVIRGSLRPMTKGKDLCA